PGFVWSQIESADYRQYIANLRAVGCPEETIRDLIGTELLQLYAPRTAAIFPFPKHEYWKKSSNDRPGVEQRKELAKLDEVRSAVYQELLGVPLRQQDLINALHLQIFGPEHDLLFLPEDKAQAAMNLLETSGFLDKRDRMLVQEQN